MIKLLTANIRDKIVNCYDGTYDKETLKKWASKKILLCPACRKPYEYCHGRVKTPYFRHMEKDMCDELYSESETQEHMDGKRDLFEWIKEQKGVKNATLEAWIPETKQRPDIMFEYDDKKYVIEYQCSPISTEYHERHELYKAGGITDIWICGIEKYMKMNMRVKEIEQHICGYYSPKHHLFYFQNCHIGYGMDIGQFLKLIKIRVGELGVEEAIDEERSVLRWRPSLCCNLNQVMFEGGNIIFRNFTDVAELVREIPKIRHDRKESQWISEDNTVIENIRNVVENKLRQLSNQDFYKLDYTHCINSSSEERCITCLINDISTKYGCYRLETPFREKICLSCSPYLSANKILKASKEILSNVAKQELSLDKSLAYFSRQTYLRIHIISKHFNDYNRKYFCICKGKGSVTEFELLTDLVRVLNINKKYSNDVYIKLPSCIDLLFGHIDYYTQDEKIQRYFERLGFKNVTME